MILASGLFFAWVLLMIAVIYWLMTQDELERKEKPPTTDLSLALQNFKREFFKLIETIKTKLARKKK